jgi:hypothetical protein
VVAKVIGDRQAKVADFENRFQVPNLAASPPVVDLAGPETAVRAFAGRALRRGGGSLANDV